MKTALVLGAAGFIGGHMVKRLKAEGYWVRGVDLKHPEFYKTEADEFIIGDLRISSVVADAIFINPHSLISIDMDALEGVNMSPSEIIKQFNETGFLLGRKDKYAEVLNKPFDLVVQFAADMGGCNYIFSGDNDANVVHNSALINLNVAKWASKYKVGKLLFSSSACVYPESIQEDTNNPGLKEKDAYPIQPDSEYGYEKIFSERMYDAYKRNYGLNVRVVRFHNIFGEEGTIDWLKAKAPASLCRKVAECPEGGEIEVLGDGLQTRSFLYIDEAIEGCMRVLDSDYSMPLNIGSDEMISINDFAKMIIEISGKNISIKNVPTNVQGVRGRNSDNTLCKEVLGWSPSRPLREGMEKLYSWVNKQVSNGNV